MMLHLASNMRQLGHLARGIYTPAAGPWGGHATLNNNVFAVYKFNETSGTTLNDELNTNDGSISGATVNQTGILDKCLSFDGNDYVTIGDTSTFKFLHGANNTSSFKWSINFWVKLDSPTTNTGWTIFGTNGLTGNTPGIGIWIDNRSSVPRTRAIAMLIGARTNQSVVSYVSPDSTYPNDSDWHMITWTYDQSLSSANAKLYVDAGYIGAGNKSGYVPSTNNSDKTPTIGIIPGGTASGLVGDLDEMVFLDGKVLTTDEIDDLYNGGSGLTY